MCFTEISTEDFLHNEGRFWHPWFILLKKGSILKFQIDGKPSSATVSFAQGRTAAQSLGTTHYCECSAKNLTGLKKVFEEAVLAGIHSAYPDGMDKQAGCIIS